MGAGFGALLTSLVCSSPLQTPAPEAYPQPEPTLQPPLPADALAPSPLVAPIPADETYTATVLRDVFSSTDARCPMPSTVTLAVQPDGAAQLRLTTPEVIDFAQCAPESSTLSWYFEGTVDAASQTAVFATCNFGHFVAQGSVTYFQQRLLGTVTCSTQDGALLIRLTVGS